MFRMAKPPVLPRIRLTWHPETTDDIESGGPIVISNKQTDRIIQALNAFHIELPSWGFANTGTRFGKFLQPAAATTTAEKFSDAGQVHRLTGVCPTVALHVLWDLPEGIGDCAEVQALAAEHGLRPGSINPNVFQDQIYKHGSLGNPDPGDPQGGPGSHSG